MSEWSSSCGKRREIGECETEHGRGWDRHGREREVGDGGKGIRGGEMGKVSTYLYEL